MPPPKSTIPAAAQPKYGDYFDAWNSSSSGHQRAENRLGGSTGWRESKNMKLFHQFKSGATGGKRLSDTVGVGSDCWGQRANVLTPKDVRERAKLSVGDMLVGKIISAPVRMEETLVAESKKVDDLKEEQNRNQQKGVFDGLVIYINGSTYPMISDHKLKHLLAESGAKVSLHLGRRKVTHVILGKPSNQGAGAGGGLSGTKIEKEIKRRGGCGVKYVGVEWALESIKAGKRLPETSFINLKLAAKEQQSVYNMFKQSSNTGSGEDGSLRADFSNHARTII